MNRRTAWISGVLFSGVSMLNGCGGTDQSPPPATTPAPTTQATTVLKIIDKEVGTGEAAEDGDTLTLNYTGYLLDGTKFDSSRNSGHPFQVVIGKHDVIAGWEQGLRGMKAGGIRQLIIPPDLAYGAQGYPPKIPPNATLNFEIELLVVNK